MLGLEKAARAKEKSERKKALFSLVAVEMQSTVHQGASFDAVMERILTNVSILLAF